MATPSGKSNRLASETSPYLLQHAQNPVDWYPWGPEAFAASKALNKPILLSIGYAACHWCHVMAHESFDDEATAELMNAHFINVKVDREERPDIDRIYMDALHHMGEQGGWPLTMFLDTQRRPFWGGTYFPPRPMYGRPSFSQILTQLAHIWQSEPDKIKSNGEIILQSLALPSETPQAHQISDEHIPALLQQLMRVIDWDNGGIGRAPKFPQSPVFQLLHVLARTTGSEQADKACEKTMRSISQGGIYDHLAGGIARYTVDERWLVPHFEKMLYDNAQFVNLLSQMINHQPNNLFRQRIEETLDWLLRDMRTPNQLFASSYDADSEGEEGKFYCWQHTELQKWTKGSTQNLFNNTYDVRETGNWEGKTILNRLEAQELLSENQEAELSIIRERLLQIRNKRIWPGFDDKNLTDWNALTIQAIARAAMALNRPDLLDVAKTTFSALVKTLTSKAKLHHSYRDKQIRTRATCDDYAQLISAAICLYEATLESCWIDQAKDLTEDLIADYTHQTSGAFHYVANDCDDAIVRQIIWNCDVFPNGNATMIINLWKLASLTGQPHYTEHAEKILAAFNPYMMKNGLAYPTAWLAWLTLRHQPQYILTGCKTHVGFDDLHHATCKKAPANAMVMHVEDPTALPHVHAAASKPKSTVPTLYICENQTCSLPITEPSELEQL